MLVLRLNILLSIILYDYVFLRMNVSFLRLNMLMIGFDVYHLCNIDNVYCELLYFINIFII